MSCFPPSTCGYLAWRVRNEPWTSASACSDGPAIHRLSRACQSARQRRQASGQEVAKANCGMMDMKRLRTASRTRFHDEPVPEAGRATAPSAHKVIYLPTTTVTTVAHARLPLANAVSHAKAECEHCQKNRYFHSCQSGCTRAVRVRSAQRQEPQGCSVYKRNISAPTTAILHLSECIVIAEA
jgi:hypothetical protein